MSLKRWLKRGKILDVDDLTHTIGDIAKRHGFYEVYLCGDYALGTPYPGSVVRIYIWSDEPVCDYRAQSFSKAVERRIGKPVLVLPPGYDPDYTRKFIKGKILCQSRNALTIPWGKGWGSWATSCPAWRGPGC